MTDGIDATQPLWFYDFVSPFSYLLLEQHDKWPGLPFALTPVLLNDLYRHWGQRVAYDVPAKRIFTYRYALFRAEQLGIPFRMPPSHPFDSTKPMLLSVALGSDLHTVREIFRFIWREGRDPSSEEGFEQLCVGFEIRSISGFRPQLLAGTGIKAVVQGQFQYLG